MLHSNHQALKFLNGQHKINLRHAKWVKFLQFLFFVSSYKKGTINIVVDALSMRHLLLSILDARVLGFQLMKDHYDKDEDMSRIIKECLSGVYGDFIMQKGFSSKGIGYMCQMDHLGSS